MISITGRQESQVTVSINGRIEFDGTLAELRGILESHAKFMAYIDATDGDGNKREEEESRAAMRVIEAKKRERTCH